MRKKVTFLLVLYVFCVLSDVKNTLLEICSTLKHLKLYFWKRKNICLRDVFPLFISEYVTAFWQFLLPGGRSSFNWLTGSSIDTLAEYAVPSSSESLSSSMLLVSKRSEKFKQATFKPVGPDFGKKRLGLPGDEVDSKAKGL